jgi:hypothetical protein
MFPYVVCF